MAGYQKEIIYLSYKEKGEKVKNAGFVRVLRFEKEIKLDMQITGLSGTVSQKASIMLKEDNEQEKKIGEIEILKGRGTWNQNVSLKKPFTIWIMLSEEQQIIGRTAGGAAESKSVPVSNRQIENKNIDGGLEAAENKADVVRRNTLEKILLKKSKDAGWGDGITRDARAAENAAADTAVRRTAEIHVNTPINATANAAVDMTAGIASEEVKKPQETAARVMLNEFEKPKTEQQIILSDKWKQLMQLYPMIHPYEDEREYLSIQPKDFVVMTGDHQHLANNSFLLHGYYNYRHVILGKEKIKEEEVFYLGVPGVYYEREKMVALMFGFEAFECNGGKAEAGKFGYYLRKVTI